MIEMDDDTLNAAYNTEKMLAELDENYVGNQFTQNQQQMQAQDCYQRVTTSEANELFDADQNEYDAAHMRNSMSQQDYNSYTIDKNQLT